MEDGLGGGGGMGCLYSDPIHRYDNRREHTTESRIIH